MAGRADNPWSTSDTTSHLELKDMTQHIEKIEEIEQVNTNERVPGHHNYYEQDGLRTYGDGEGVYYTEGMVRDGPRN